MKIFLTYRRADFLEIYNRNNNGNWLLNESTKGSVFVLLLSIVGLFISIILDYAQNIIPIIIIVLGFTVFNFIAKLYTYYKWRKGIKEYLDRQDKFKTHTIEITRNYFSVEQDLEITIERLDQIKTCKIDEHFIRLTGENNYLIPKKSMSAEEYSTLTILLKEAIKNIEQE